MKHIVVGTAGHIDHGKSSLVQALTGIDPDRLKEEKIRGITVDLGFGHYQHAGMNIAFIDVPGHERFVRNMLAGASGIDFVLLVVAADESIMPQTREHFDICRLLGVDAGLIAITKCDLVDSETIELVKLEIRDLVGGSFLEDAPIVAVSARTENGLQEIRDAIQHISGSVSSRRHEGFVRLPIDRAFTIKGFGTVVTGTLVSGELGLNCDLDVLPTGFRAKVRGLQVHGEDRDIARGGQRVAVNLSGVDVRDLSRGDTLVVPGGLEISHCFDATLTMLSGINPLKHGARVRCHQGTTEVMGRVSLATLINTNKVHNSTREPYQEDFLKELEPSSSAYVRIRLEQPAALTRGDRFVLRAYSPMVTIAGGIVIDPTPPRGRLRSRQGIARLRRLANLAEPHEGVAQMLEESGLRGLSLSTIESRAGIVPSNVEKFLEVLISNGSAVMVGDRVVSPTHLETLSSQIIKIVQEFHVIKPLETGLPLQEARERFGRITVSEILDYVISNLVRNGTLVSTDCLALASHKVSLSGEESAVREFIEKIFQNAGLQPPEVSRLSKIVDADSEIVDRILRLLLKDGSLVKIESLIFHSQTLERLKREVMGLKGGGAKVTQLDVGYFKEKFGISRKYAIPLLGYLDREHVTRRVGAGRVLI